MRSAGCHVASATAQDFDLGCFTAFGKANDDILLLNGPKVAMDRIRRMHENSRSSGRIEGGYDLLPDDRTFPDPGNNYPPFGIIDQLHTFNKISSIEFFKPGNGL